ncbi:glia-derived nexin [Erpetoichthys calabaricus]|uniref:Serpin peptidase inhibitor, clade E (nexin, plasminogen activator inhibitor type 1), member 2 n=1 Tax=Erpetoichthys calabaricus TaxID=27687 RepID=A0A8C4X718_ERPCA|nr:glia-derived nexin [Erpetoichthys calabaricus]XP_028650252.1 glia-derived nexin [Erpetoichthys calabaricus]XP_028650253.1 glia-derived nexin [Erpetoichthys calabaricus]
MGHLICLLLLGVAVSFVQNQHVGQLAYGELGSDFGIQVFAEVAKLQPRINIVMSPHGIANVLGILQVGADGNTKKQLVTAMRYGMNGASKMLRKIQKSISSRKNKDIVTVANGMFAQKGLKMEEPFVTRSKDMFQCEVRSVNFGDADKAAAFINEWVKNKTKDMIDHIIGQDSLNPLVKLVVVNAIYFKGMWASRFQAENTKLRNFSGGDGTVYQVPMMAQLSLFNIGSTSTPDGLQYTYIELPYHGNSISMLVAFPVNYNTPLSELLPHISTKTIQSWLGLMTQRRVGLVIPKFTVETETDLKPYLSALGIKDMFQAGKANFAKITRSEQLSVSKAFQKAKIEVNEEGTKASAATAVVMMARSSPQWIIIDRPFVFFIRHNPTGTILFMGQINKP